MQHASITEQRRRGGDNIVTDIVRLFHDVTELIHRVYRRLQHFEDVGNGPQAHIKIMPLDPLRRIILEPQLFSKPCTGAVRQIRAPQRPWPPLYRRRPLATQAQQTQPPVSPVNQTPSQATPVHQTPPPVSPVHQTPPPATPVHRTPPPVSPVHQTPPPVIIDLSPRQPTPLSPIPNQLSPPNVPNAQVPPPHPFAHLNNRRNQTIFFRQRTIVPGPTNRGDRAVHINYPTHTIDLPPFNQPDNQFRQWLRDHRIPDDAEFLWQVRFDLELRRGFLRRGNTNGRWVRIVVGNTPPSFANNPPHLLALARLALNSYTEEQVHALLFCVTRLTSDGIIA